MAHSNNPNVDFMAMRDWFLTDKAWKFFSLVLAVSIWLIVNKIRGESPTPAAGSQKILPLGNIPVSVVSAPSDARDFRVDPETVAVAIEGPPELLSNLQPYQVHAFVDLSDLTAASQPRQSVNVSLPSGLTFVSANPPKVDVIVLPSNQ
ncbi:MAG TPA: CdaR family protein [Verrucomicrobiae bacterium]|nr:CdaR family protein [Verrucomicrobiae bacterium]